METSLEVVNSKSLEQKILEEDNVDELKNMVNLFNLNIKKKEIVRASKLSGIQDMISNQMEERLLKHADEFSNKDLIDYFKVVQETLSKSDNTLDTVDMPAIQINQNQVNINVQDGLSRESKEKVVDALKSIFARYSENDLSSIIDVEDNK